MLNFYTVTWKGSDTCYNDIEIGEYFMVLPRICLDINIAVVK